jgi:signal transduction histidine kinase
MRLGLSAKVVLAVAAALLLGLGVWFAAWTRLLDGSARLAASDAARLVASSLAGHLSLSPVESPDHEDTHAWVSVVSAWRERVDLPRGTELSVQSAPGTWLVPPPTELLEQWADLPIGEAAAGDPGPVRAGQAVSWASVDSGDGAVVVAAVDVAPYLERAGRMRELLALFGVVVAALALVVGWSLLSTAAVRPIRSLTALVERVALRGGDGADAGQPSRRAPPSAGDEVAQLRRAFDDLLVRLADYERRTEVAMAESRASLDQVRAAQDSLLRNERLAAVGLLTAGVAHELGTPISILLGYLELLSDPDVSAADRAEYLDRIRMAAQRVSAIVHDLLDFSRPDPAPAQGPCIASVVAVVEQCRKLLSAQSRFREVTLELSVATDVLVAVESRRLEQVLVNLLLNAADAMQAKGRVRVLARTEGQVGIIEVSDEGPGLEPQARARVFDPFFSTKAPGKGTGLGLAICRQIVEAYGGSISVDSEPGCGATFVLRVPLVAS